MGDRQQKDGQKEKAKRPKQPKGRERPISTHSDSTNDICSVGEGKSDTIRRNMATSEVYSRSGQSNGTKELQKSRRANQTKYNSTHYTDEQNNCQIKPHRAETGRNTSRKREKFSTPSDKFHLPDFSDQFMSLNLETHVRDVCQPSSSKIKDKPLEASTSEHDKHADAHCLGNTNAEKRKKCVKLNEEKKSNISSKDKGGMKEDTVRDKTTVNSKAPKKLKDVVERLKMKMADISVAAEKVKNVVEAILTSDLLKRDILFRYVKRMHTGSYYEKLKISKPNEFDIMLEISISGRRVIELTNVTGAFYTLAYKQRKPSAMAGYLDRDGNISAVQILFQFRKLVSDIIRQSGMEVYLQKKDPLSPAVTLLIGKKPDVISVDLVPALKLDQSWPASDGMNIDDWLGTKVKQAYKRDAFYMVPKKANLGKKNNIAPQATTTNAAENCMSSDDSARRADQAAVQVNHTKAAGEDSASAGQTTAGSAVVKPDTWRISFSNIEKAIMTNHGSGKTCCEDKGEMCCRKQCLKLMKHLLELLKKNGNKRKMDGFCSYHAKTALLHICAQTPKDEDWKLEDLDLCFDRYIKYFQTCLKEYSLPNFFLPSHNLFSPEFIDKASCNYLYEQIEKEKKMCYAIFYLEK
ncbi:cyclic GMP-AMP synthase-like isoform X1 [Mixophyes fleayi]|uniref:cyclic GMP-AMP synthase-like isoform X1 n=1 Tax=Mixophyes fleayi TaxID=3061075 RepID=UPI003F4D79F6